MIATGTVVPSTESCRVCGSNISEPWGEENGFSAVRCADCGLVYLSPWPDLRERDRALQYGAHPGDKTINTNHKPHPELIAEYRSVLRDLYPNGLGTVRWLDIGCGYGEFLLALKGVVADGSVLAGSEPSEVKSAWARSQALDVAYRDLASIKERYTHVSLLNVFSHLPDPVDFLAQCRDLLQRGGDLVLQTGNGGDVERREFPGELWFPDHLIFASRKTLIRVIDELGMKVVDLKDYRFPAITLTNIAKDVAKRVLRRGSYNPVVWRGGFRTLWMRATLR